MKFISIAARKLLKFKLLSRCRENFQQQTLFYFMNLIFETNVHEDEQKKRKYY